MSKTKQDIDTEFIEDLLSDLDNGEELMRDQIDEDTADNKGLDMKTQLPQCPMCNNGVETIFRKYKSPNTFPNTSIDIIVEDVPIYVCINKLCEHTWLSIENEKRIDKAIDNLIEENKIAKELENE